MPSEKATAIVIRTVEFSETSLVVTLFTREFGKIGALAKGARRLKGPFESALDLLALCRIVFLHKSSDALDLLTEAKLLRRFRPAGRNRRRSFASVNKSRASDDLWRKTIRQRASRSRADSKGPLSRLAPFANAPILPNSRVNSVTTRLVSLNSTVRITMAVAF